MAATGGTLTLESHADDMKRLAEGLARPVAPLMKRLELVLVADTKTEVFAKGQSPDGVTWPPLKHPRLRTAGNDLPLRDTGLLMSSLTGGSKGKVSRLNGSTLVWGTNIEHAAIHQHGGTVLPTGGRKFLAIPATKEAFYKGSPLRWPADTLKPIIGKKGGVLVETTEAKGTAGLKKQIAAAVTRLRKLTGKKTATGTRTALTQKIKLLRGQVAKKAAAALKVQYYLTRKVIIPARPFIGFGQRLKGKVVRAVSDYYFGGESNVTTNYRGP